MAAAATAPGSHRDQVRRGVPTLSVQVEPLWKYADRGSDFSPQIAGFRIFAITTDRTRNTEQERTR